jgi:hypothetical protein
MRSLVIPLLLVHLGLRAQQTDAKQYVPSLIGFYNLENLFDTIDSPDTEDSEYLPGSAKQWNTTRYQRKLDQMARVIAELGRDVRPDGVAVLGLAEVENGQVVEDLVHTRTLKERGYRVVSHEGPDERGVDVAFIYDPARFHLIGQKAYRLYIPGEPDFLTRDQLLISGEMDGDTLYCMVAHWPSRRGGEKRSRPYREAAADLGRHVVDSLLGLDPDARIIYMGDLNDDPVDRSVRQHMRTTAEKGLARDGSLFNPMEGLYDKGIGTLAWRDSWNLFDQMLLSPALANGQGGAYKYYGAKVFNQPYLRQTEGNFAGYPHRTFVGDTYQDGYSDHFPVYVVLVREL